MNHSDFKKSRELLRNIKACPYEKIILEKVKNNNELDDELLAHLATHEMCRQKVKLLQEEAPLVVNDKVYFFEVFKKIGIFNFNLLLSKFNTGDFYQLLKPEYTMLGPGDYILCYENLRSGIIPGTFDIFVDVLDKEYSKIKIKYKPCNLKYYNGVNISLTLQDVSQDMAGITNYLDETFEIEDITIKNDNSYRIRVGVDIHEDQEEELLLNDLKINSLSSMQFKKMTIHQKNVLCVYVIKLLYDSKAKNFPESLIDLIKNNQQEYNKEFTEVILSKLHHGEEKERFKKLLKAWSGIKLSDVQ